MHNCDNLKFRVITFSKFSRVWVTIRICLPRGATWTSSEPKNKISLAQCYDWLVLNQPWNCNGITTQRTKELVLLWNDLIGQMIDQKYPLRTLQLQAPWAYVRYWICAWNTRILNRHMYDHDNHKHDHNSHWNVVISKNSFNSHHELRVRKRTEKWYFNLSFNSIWSFTRRF